MTEALGPKVQPPIDPDGGRDGLIEYMPTLAETAAAHRRHGLDKFLSWPTLATLAVLAVVMYGASVWVFPPEYQWLGVLVLPTVALGGWLPLARMWLRAPALARRLARQRARSYSSIFVSWSEAGFAARTATGNSMTPWGHYARWREDDKVVLLYLTELLFQFIPKRVLSAEQLESMRAAAAAADVPGARR